MGPSVSDNYWALPALVDYYLEDSWVLDVAAHPGELQLRLDFVLRESHPAFSRPKPGEQYCYRRGILHFREVRGLTWQGQGIKPSRDATGELDYGSVDTLLVDDGRYVIQGSFGEIEVVSDAPAVELLDD